MAKSGEIGGFSIQQNVLESVNSYDGGKFVLYPDNGFIAFLNTTKNIWAGIGANVLPATAGIKAVGRFENGESNQFGTNLGVVISAKGAATNIALDIPDGKLRMGGFIGKTGYISLETQRIPGNTTYLGIRVVNGLIVDSGYFNYNSQPPGLS